MIFRMTYPLDMVRHKPLYYTQPNSCLVGFPPGELWDSPLFLEQDAAQ